MKFRILFIHIFILNLFLILFMTACGPSPYKNLQSKIAKVDSVMIKGSALKNANRDSLQNEQKFLAINYTTNLDPDKVPVNDLFAAGQLFYFAEKTDSAIQVMERKPLDQADFDYMDFLFQLYTIESKIDKAENLFENYIFKLNPAGLDNYYMYIMYGYIELGQFEKALKVVDNAIANLDESLTVSLLLDKAEIYNSMGNIENAKNTIKVAEDYKNLTDKNKKKIAAKKQLINMIGKPATELRVDKWLGRKPVKLDQLKGKVILLDFWAPWCPPCRAIMPYIQKLYDEYKDQGLEVIGVTQFYGYFNQLGKNLKNLSNSEEAAWVNKFKKENNITIPTAMSVFEKGGFNAKSYGVYGIPHMVLIDKQGKVRLYTIGSGESSEEKLTNGIKQLLNENI